MKVEQLVQILPAFFGYTSIQLCWVVSQLTHMHGFLGKEVKLFLLYCTDVYTQTLFLS